MNLNSACGVAYSGPGRPADNRKKMLKSTATRIAPVVPSETNCYKADKLNVLSGSAEPHCLTFTRNSLLVCAGSDPDLLDRFLGRVVPAEVRICDIDNRSLARQLEYVEHGLKVLYGAVMRSDCLDEGAMRPLISRAHELGCTASLLFLRDRERTDMAPFEHKLEEAPSWLYQPGSWDGMIVLDLEASRCVRGLLMV